MSKIDGVIKKKMKDLLGISKMEEEAMNQAHAQAKLEEMKRYYGEVLREKRKRWRGMQESMIQYNQAQSQMTQMQHKYLQQAMTTAPNTGGMGAGLVTSSSPTVPTEAEELSRCAQVAKSASETLAQALGQLIFLGGRKLERKHGRMLVRMTRVAGWMARKVGEVVSPLIQPEVRMYTTNQAASYQYGFSGYTPTTTTGYAATSQYTPTITSGSAIGGFRDLIDNGTAANYSGSFATTPKSKGK